MSIISAIGLYILVSIFSPGTESNARWKILFIAIAAGYVLWLVTNALPNLVGLLLAVMASLTLIVALLVFWCQIDRKAALKIAGGYFGVCVAGFFALNVVAALWQRS